MVGPLRGLLAGCICRVGGLTSVYLAGKAAREGDPHRVLSLRSETADGLRESQCSLLGWGAVWHGAVRV